MHRVPVRLQLKRSVVVHSSRDVTTVLLLEVDVVVKFTAVPVWATAGRAKSRRATRGRRMDGSEG
ncbi:hypothetical protein D7X74_19665 [Corallococcus sp. CA047B]|nr:hypothetical protein D7X74_19665 [Corallococcus sp. CA047B]